jgi:tetratricopeptide (TPR) repeat protein
MLAPGGAVTFKYGRESVKYVSPGRRSSLWATLLALFVSPPHLFLNDQMIQPGQDISSLVNPEQALTCALALKPWEETDPIAAFTLEVEMDAEAWLLRARALQELQKQKICYEKALEIEPYNITIQMALNKRLLEQNDVQGAIKGYQKILEKEPNHIEAAKALATIYWTKDPQKALVIYQRLLRIQPDQQLEHYKQIARLQERMGLSPTETYRKILSLDKDDPDAAQGMGAIHAKYVNQAQELEKKGELVKAIQEMKSALSIQSSSEAKSYIAALYNNLAYSLAKGGRYEGAIENYQASLKYEQNVTTHLNLGHAYVDNKEPAKALKAVEKAASLKPKEKEVLKNTYLFWADLLMAEKENTEAIKKLEDIHVLLPKDPQIVKTLGVAYWKDGDLSNALETMKALPPLLESVPEQDRVEAYGMLGDLHRHLGEKEEDLKERISHYERALKAYQQALSLKSGNKEIQKRWDEVAQERKALKIQVLKSS